MTWRLCCNVRQDIRATHVWHLIRSFNKHTPRICSGPSTVLGAGESPLRKTVIHTSRHRGQTRAQSQARVAHAVLGRCTGEFGVQNGVSEPGGQEGFLRAGNLRTEV